MKTVPSVICRGHDRGRRAIGRSERPACLGLGVGIEIPSSSVRRRRSPALSPTGGASRHRRPVVTAHRAALLRSRARLESRPLVAIVGGAASLARTPALLRPSTYPSPLERSSSCASAPPIERLVQARSCRACHRADSTASPRSRHSAQHGHQPRRRFVLVRRWHRADRRAAGRDAFALLH